MSGQRVIAEIRAQGAEIRALLAETRAELRAEIAANTDHIAALDSRLESMGCAVYATLALVAALAAAGLLNWISGRWGNQRTVRNQSTGEGPSE